jgi:membrane protein CcdC involved in cytochrome C biogenesis
MISIYVLMFFLNSTSINFCTLHSLMLLIILTWKARYNVKSGTVYRKASKDHTKHTHFVNLRYVDI